ncbi:hypothetical protein E6H35_08255 [Candidatus Bathyarchaeota archaeon]|nr:MAG: hypothetical protein E6H35_08255 [Candidatus Bathyarchaeota archaeon]
MLPSQDASHSPDDEKILEYAVELFRELRITRPEPDTVTWDDGMRPDLVVVKYGEVRLPRSMMGRLTAEDWKPLLTPPMIYSYFLLHDPIRDYAVRLFLPLAIGLCAVGFDAIQIIRSSQPDYVRELNLANLVILLFYIPVIALYVRRRWRSFSYIADRRAADTIGKEVLLAAFAKYGETISATGYPRKRVHLWPTVSQRIERLQKDLR